MTSLLHRFVKFQLGTGLSNQVNERHVSSLLYCLVYLPYTVVPIISLCNIIVSIFLVYICLHNNTVIRNLV